MLLLSIHLPTIGEHFKPRPIFLASAKFYGVYSKYVGYLSVSKYDENYEKVSISGMDVSN
jgi:hypothetical protein